MHVPLHSSLNGGRTGIEIMGNIDRELAFSIPEYRRRVEGIRSGMTRMGVDLLITREPSNVLYISGFQTFAVFGGETVIISHDNDPILVVWPPELGMAVLHTWLSDVYGYEPGYGQEAYLGKLISDFGLPNSRIAIEKNCLGFNLAQNEKLNSVFPESEIIDGSDLIQSLRKIKSREEINHIRQSASITDKGIEAAVEAARENSSDNYIAAAANAALIGNGSEYFSISPIVTSGKRSGILHSSHKRKCLEKGDVILLEMGASYQRYTAPIMRTVTIGASGDEVLKTADACLVALDNVISAIKPGVSADEVARAGWKGIDKAGSDFVFHGVFGYAVGVSLPPGWADGTSTISLGQETVMEPGMVFHHPVALRRIGQYGVAFSETTLVTDTGCEVLTGFERKLHVK